MPNLRRLITQQKAFYKSIVSVYCPILGDTVYFTSDGFIHLLYQSNRKPRKVDEQYMKLKCLTYAPEVVKNCTLISETRQIKKMVKGKQKMGVHFELVYEVSSKKKIRVIVERIGTGKHKFLSVMPHNKRSKH